MTSHSFIVGVLLCSMGGTLLTLNIQEAIRLREARMSGSNAEVAPVRAPAVETDGMAMPADTAADSGPGDQRSRGNVAATEAGSSSSSKVPEANQIPRVRVAALAMPLGVGLLLIGGAVVTCLTKSSQAVQVTATLAGVAGVLMLLLGMEQTGSLLNWGTDPLVRSTVVLLISGILCLSLPGRWLWTQANDNSSSNH